MLTFEEIEKLILTGAGIQAFEKIHEKKKRILSAYLDCINELMKQIEKEKSQISKLLKKIKEINEVIEKLNNQLTMLDHTLRSEEAQKTVRATLIDDIFARRLLDDIKKLKKQLFTVKLDLERLIEERPHYIYWMYINRWSEDARESLRLTYSQKRSLFDFGVKEEV